MNALLSKLRTGSCVRLSALALALAVTTAAAPSMASTFQLQSNTIILEEREGRTAFNIKNPGTQPILLVSKVEDLDASGMAGNVIVTPAVTRIDPGQSQLVNFSLKKGVTLDHEYLLRASFEGVSQKAERGMRMPIRQQIGLIVQPKQVAAETQPWRDLRVAVEGSHLKVHNTGKHVIRIGPALTLQPSGAVVTLPHPYLMAGESIDLPVESMGAATQVEIVPLSRYGFANEKALLPLTP